MFIWLVGILGEAKLWEILSQNAELETIDLQKMLNTKKAKAASKRAPEHTSTLHVFETGMKIKRVILNGYQNQTGIKKNQI